MISLSTTAGARPGYAVEKFLEQYGFIWDEDQLYEEALLSAKSLYSAVNTIIDAWLTTADEPIVLTWTPTDEETPNNYPVLSEDSLIGQLFVKIRGDSRALMLMVGELELSPPEGATYVLAIYKNKLELNGRVIWTYRPEEPAE